MVAHGVNNQSRRAKLGGSKVFKCPECGHTLNRDFNGALGIMLKALSDKTFTVVKNGKLRRI
ncbi:MULTISPECIES: transposase [Microcystis]|uniref:Zinc ribbon domain-containing protein n=1 Tax=Microcystis wesenbergii NRERC-220 TaxID=3068991 RepID=A0ABU3HRP4_9CHRO|nr:MULTISPECIES: transposase [Microcystis]MCZ8038348.1 zinc ribbon domain-containing protein [Microcystis sp. LE17-20A]MDT3677153.1 zinc ribbon domain-containing protein [Microcystis wesenbergii NRERC-220]